MPSDSEDEEFMSTAITEDTVIFAVMAKTLDEASLEIEQPVCGDEVVKNETGNPSQAKNAPAVYLPQTGDYALERNSYSCYWSKGDRADTPFYGTIEGGTEYKACIRLIPKAGLVFTDDPRINVTGGTYIDDGFSPWDKFNQVLFVTVSVRAAHEELTAEKKAEPEEVEVQKASCTRPGYSYISYRCRNCGESLHRELKTYPAFGHDWDEGKVTYKKVKVNKKKYARKFTVNKKTGKITVKKGVKKGTYKLTVKVSAAGNGDYEAGSRNVTVKIRVK